MYSSLRLQPISHSHYQVSGNVIIHDSAAIAPGVLLQADPNSRIVIGAGVCIGIGSILHAHEGSLEVEQGAIIGAEVLLIGSFKVGTGACVGAATTVFNHSVEAGEVISPGSLIGDVSRQADELNVTDTVVTDDSASSTPPSPTTVEPSQPDSENGQVPDNIKVQVFGQVYVNNLLMKMLPNSQHARQYQPPESDQSLGSS